MHLLTFDGAHVTSSINKSMACPWFLNSPDSLPKTLNDPTIWTLRGKGQFLDPNGSNSGMWKSSISWGCSEGSTQYPQKHLFTTFERFILFLSGRILKIFQFFSPISGPNSQLKVRSRHSRVKTTVVKTSKTYQPSTAARIRCQYCKVRICFFGPTVDGEKTYGFNSPVEGMLVSLSHYLPGFYTSSWGW